MAKSYPEVTARSKVTIPSETPTRKVVILGADTERGRQKLWYFSFGSNMDPECLTQHRGVKPTASHACSVEGFTLAFTYRGDAHCACRARLAACCRQHICRILAGPPHTSYSCVICS